MFPKLASGVTDQCQYICTARRLLVSIILVACLGLLVK